MKGQLKISLYNPRKGTKGAKIKHWGTPLEIPEESDLRPSIETHREIILQPIYSCFLFQNYYYFYYPLNTFELQFSHLHTISWHSPSSNLP